MCGIVGAMLKDVRSISNEDFKSALNLLEHRGPDESGTCLIDNVYFGSRRLAIIDIKNGQQPMFSADRKNVVVFNGAIYNFKELCRENNVENIKGDTEFISNILDDSCSILPRLSGMFAIAKYNISTKKLIIARDKFGVKPLYYYFNADLGIFLFGSEIKSVKHLLKKLNINLTFNKSAVRDYFNFGYIPQPCTIYNEISVLEKGSFLTIENWVLKKRIYFSRIATKSDGLYSQKILNELITNSVRKRLISDVPVDLFLSGGLDSSVIAMKLHELNSVNRAYTFQSKDSNFDEVKSASLVANKFGFEHIIIREEEIYRNILNIVVRNMDQPFCDPSVIPTLMLASGVNKRSKVILNGDGGDELFAGYRRYRLSKYAKFLNHINLPYLPFEGFYRSISARYNRIARMTKLPDNEKYIGYVSNILSSELGRIFLSESLQLDVTNSNYPNISNYIDLRNADYDINLPSALLVKMDMALSYNSIEGRSPFMDDNLNDYILSLDSKFLVGGKTKDLLRKLYKDELPREVIYGQKKGFEFKIENALTDEVLEEVLSALTNPLFSQWFNVGNVKKILTGGELGVKGVNVDYLKLSLVIFILWMTAES